MSGGMSARFDADEAENDAVRVALLAPNAGRNKPDTTHSAAAHQVAVRQVASQEGAAPRSVSYQEPRREVVAEPPPAEKVRPRSSHWRGRYQLGAVVVDLTAAVCAAVLAYEMRFGSHIERVAPVPAVALALFPFSWIALLGLSRAYEVRIL